MNSKNERNIIEIRNNNNNNNNNNNSNNNNKHNNNNLYAMKSIQSKKVIEDNNAQGSLILNSNKEKNRKKKEKKKERKNRKKTHSENLCIKVSQDMKNPKLNPPFFPHPQNSPWLLYLSHGKLGINYTFHSMENNSSYIKSMPHFAHKSCVMCSNGWLLLEDQYNKQLTLINPSSMETIHIPAPPPLIPIKQHKNSFFSYTMTGPPTDENSILFLTSISNPFMKIFCFSSQKWVTTKFHIREDCGLSNIVILNGEIFGFTRYLGRFVSVVFDEHNKPIIKYLNVEEPEDQFEGCFIGDALIVSRGELYMVRTVELLWTRILDGFSVFKMNLNEMRWERVNSIGDEAFFYHYRFEGVSCDALQAGLVGNCIYYVHRDNHLCRYNLANRGITLLHSFPRFRPDAQLCWLLPKTKDYLTRLESNQSTKSHTGSSKECERTCDRNYCIDRPIRDIREMEVGGTSSTRRFEANLPGELVQCIITRLSYLDTRCIGQAIPNWLPFIRQTQKPLPGWSISNNPPPCLVSFSNDYKTCTLIDPLRGMKHVIRSPPEMPCNVKILCSKHGWLLMMSSNASNRRDRGSLSANIFFYNPLSKAIIQLPPYEFYHHNFSFTSPPTSPNCVVVGAHFCGFGPTINICCRGDAQWTEIERHFEENELIVTLNTLAVYHKDKFHFLSVYGRIGLFDPVTRSWEVRGRKEIIERRMQRHYLVESDKGLFWVQATQVGDKIRVYKFDYCDYEWKVSESLEGLCLFLWRNSSISVSVKSLGVKEETVYFPTFQDGCFVPYSCTQPKMEPKRKFYGAEELVLDSCWIQPCWIQHTNQELKWF